MKLDHCLALSDQSYEHAAQVFKAHTKRLASMKQEVESIHKRIRWVGLWHCCVCACVVLQSSWHAPCSSQCGCAT